jgi:hypothetical protein
MKRYYIQNYPGPVVEDQASRGFLAELAELNEKERKNDECLRQASPPMDARPVCIMPHLNLSQWYYNNTPFEMTTLLKYPTEHSTKGKASAKT